MIGAQLQTNLRKIRRLRYLFDIVRYKRAEDTLGVIVAFEELLYLGKQLLIVLASLLYVLLPFGRWLLERALKDLFDQTPTISCHLGPYPGCATFHGASML